MSRRSSMFLALALALPLAAACGDDVAVENEAASGGATATSSSTSSATGAGGATDASSASSGTGGEGGSEADPPEVAAAIAACYETLQGQVEGRSAALEALKAAVEQHPDSGRGHLFLGMCSLAALAEDGDIGALGDIEPSLTRAIELMPEDRRIPGWLATVRVQTALVLGDDEGLEAAIEEMIEAADLYPEFNNVSLAIAFAALPLDTPWPEMAVERLAAIEDCGETDAKCRDNEAAPHNVPGSSMLFGDVYARVGRVDEARGYYQSALDADSAATWPLADEAQLLLDGVDDRADAFADADPDNDPDFFLSGTRTCRACHE